MKSRIRIAWRVVAVTWFVSLISSVALAQLVVCGDDEVINFSIGGDCTLPDGPGSAIPEPTAALLFAAGGLIVAGVVRKKRKS